MNARQPIFCSQTANPCADAERWADEQDRREAMAEALEIEAGRIVLAELQSLSPAQWFSPAISGSRPFSADEILMDAIEVDDETKDKWAEFMTSPAVQKVHAAMAAFHAKHHWRDIVGSRADDV